jgi:TPR repeat protein
MYGDLYRSFPGMEAVVDQAVADLFRSPSSLTAATDAAVDRVQAAFPDLSAKNQEFLNYTVADEIARRRQYLFSDPQNSGTGSYNPLGFKFNFPESADEGPSVSAGPPLSGARPAGPTPPWPRADNDSDLRGVLGQADTALRRGNARLAETLASPLALAGDTAAQIFLSQLYTQIGDRQKAKYWLQICASKGWEDCLFNLATLYAEEGNYDAAELALFHLANKGQVDAQAQLGTLYLHTGRTQEAEKWLCKADAAGHEIAAENLTLFYGKSAEAFATSGNHVQSFKYYELAAHRQSHLAQFCLGNCYENGVGVAKNFQLAAYWYLMAANNSTLKNPRAIGRIARPEWGVLCGQLYRFGFYVEKNPRMARRYFEEAQAQGNADASRYLEEMDAFDPERLSADTLLCHLEPALTLWTQSMIQLIRGAWPMQTVGSTLSVRFPVVLEPNDLGLALDPTTMVGQDHWYATSEDLQIVLALSRVTYKADTLLSASLSLQGAMKYFEGILPDFRSSAQRSWPTIHPSAVLSRCRGIDSEGHLQSHTVLTLIKDQAAWSVSGVCINPEQEEYILAILQEIAV